MNTGYQKKASFVAAALGDWLDRRPDKNVSAVAIHFTNRGGAMFVVLPSGSPLKAGTTNARASWKFHFQGEKDYDHTIRI